MSLLYATSYSNENAQQSALMRPSEIWFTQRKISQLFGNGWKRMTDTFGEIAKGKISVEDLPPINVFLYNNRYWVYSGNRRLRVLKELEKYNLIKHVQVYIVSPPVHNYDSFWSLATAARAGPTCTVKTVRKQREVPIEFKFACSYVYNCFAEPWFIWTVLAECIFIILFLIKEYLVSRL